MDHALSSWIYQFALSTYFSTMLLQLYTKVSGVCGIFLSLTFGWRGLIKEIYRRVICANKCVRRIRLNPR